MPSWSGCLRCLITSNQAYRTQHPFVRHCQALDASILIAACRNGTHMTHVHPRRQEADCYGAPLAAAFHAFFDLPVHSMAERACGPIWKAICAGMHFPNRSFQLSQPSQASYSSRHVHQDVEIGCSMHIKRAARPCVAWIIRRCSSPPALCGGYLELQRPPQCIDASSVLAICALPPAFCPCKMCKHSGTGMLLAARAGTASHRCHRTATKT